MSPFPQVVREVTHVGVYVNLFSRETVGLLSCVAFGKLARAAAKSAEGPIYGDRVNDRGGSTE